MSYMDEAIKEARSGSSHNHGGPFGAVIVKDGKIIARGHNNVIKTNDPTAHAEIVAIRKASAKLKTFDLSDCQIYSSCQPCPMCFAAIHWAKITKLYYGCTKEDAANIGFDDDYIYKVIKNEPIERQVEEKQLQRDSALEVFTEWQEKADKIMY